jgi:GT2 family glycosyltransferase
LIRFYHGLPEAEQERIQNLASVAPVTPKRRPFHGIRFTPSGYTPVEARGVDQPVACDAVIWSGSLYRVEVIRQLGLPSADYVLDWGEFEYGYRGTVRGFHTYLVPASLFDHDIGESAAMYYTSHGLGPMRFKLLMLPPIRIYYLVRNEIFFWLRAYPTSSWIISFRIMKRRAWIVGYAMKLVLARRWRSLSALLRGVRDGVGGKMTRRF